mgnify:CR=1 FL=1
MNKFMNWLEDSFVPKANKLFSRPFIAAFASTMQKIIYSAALTAFCIRNIPTTNCS